METPTSSAKKRAASAPLTDEATRSEKRHKAAADSKDAIYLRNQQQSPLLRLPPEIRNMIRENLCAGLNILARVRRLRQRDFELVKWQDQGAFSPSETANFSLVCRQMHTETALLPFRMGRVCFGMGFIMGRNSAHKSINWFLGKLTAAQLGVIRYVMVEIEPSSPWLQPPGLRLARVLRSERPVHGEEYQLFKHFVGLEQLELWDYSRDERELSVPYYTLKPLFGLSKSVELIVRDLWRAKR